MNLKDFIPESACIYYPRQDCDGLVRPVVVHDPDGDYITAACEKHAKELTNGKR